MTEISGAKRRFDHLEEALPEADLVTGM